MASDLSGRELGKYRLLDRVGAGGMGEVYRAFQSGLDRIVAIKLLRRVLYDELFVQRFQREARSAGSLRHPHIIQVFDFGVEDGVYYMAMEYVAGATLQRHLHLRGALPLDDALRIASQLADALDYAHTRGVIHRDIKPANVMFIAPDEGGRAPDVVLTDFGLARIKDDAGLTTSGVFLGTPYYISPEAAQGHDVDGRTDLYGLGVILYEMLTGVLPFNADTPTAVIMKHILAPVPSARDLRPDLPDSINQIVTRTLAKLPDERYPSAAAFKTAIDAARGILPEGLRATPPQLRDGQGEHTTIANVPASTAPAPTLPNTSAQTPPIRTPTRGTAAVDAAEEHATSVVETVTPPRPAPVVTPPAVTPPDSPLPPVFDSGSTPAYSTPTRARLSDSNPDRESLRRANAARRSAIQRRTTERERRERRRARPGCLIAFGVIAGVILMVGLIMLTLENAPDVLVELPTFIVRDITDTARASEASASPTRAVTDAPAESFMMLADAGTSLAQAATDVARSAANNITSAQTALADAATTIRATTEAAPTPTATPIPPTLDKLNDPTAAPTPVPLTPDTATDILPARADELLIVFAGIETNADNEVSRLLNALRTTYSMAGVRYEIVNIPDMDADATIALRTRLNAALIVSASRLPQFTIIRFTPTTDSERLGGLTDPAAHPFTYPFVFPFRTASNSIDLSIGLEIALFTTRLTAGLTAAWTNDFATAAVHLEDARQILADLPRAVASRVSMAGIDYALGFAYHQMGDYDNAVPALDRALESASDLETPYADYARFYRGMTALGLNDYETTISVLNAANLTALPSYYALYGLSALATAQISVGDSQTALTTLETAIQLIPDDPYLYYLRGSAYYNLNDLPSAIGELTGAIILNPDMTEAYAMRGRAYQQLGVLNAAAEDYRAYQRLTGMLDDDMRALLAQLDAPPTNAPIATALPAGSSGDDDDGGGDDG
jgi:serine/threonine-protein kinase